MNTQISILVGRRSYAAAIEMLRRGLPKSTTPGEDLSLIAHCHLGMGSDIQAIAAAADAVRIDQNCCSAYRTLATVHARHGNHQLGLLAARNAIRTYVPPVKIPALIVRVLVAISWLKGGRAAAVGCRKWYAGRESRHKTWLAWANDYVEWGNRGGMSCAANDPIKSVPNPEV